MLMAGDSSTAHCRHVHASPHTGSMCWCRAQHGVMAAHHPLSSHRAFTTLTSLRAIFETGDTQVCGTHVSPSPCNTQGRTSKQHIEGTGSQQHGTTQCQRVTVPNGSMVGHGAGLRTHSFSGKPAQYSSTRAWRFCKYGRQSMQPVSRRTLCSWMKQLDVGTVKQSLICLTCVPMMDVAVPFVGVQRTF